MKKLLAILLALTATCAMANEAEVKKAAEEFAAGRGTVEAVRKSLVPGLYEVQLSGNELIYVTENGKYAFFGSLIDLKARRNLTEERKNKLSQIKFSDLPLELAIKQVRGNGKRVMATFEDPNCGYCKKLAREMQSLKDVTIYTFALPVLSDDSIVKANNIMCASDTAKTWNDWMLNGVVPPTAKCDSPVEKVSALGRKLGVQGTPAIFFADGSRNPGYLPAAELENKLNAATSKP